MRFAALLLITLPAIFGQKTATPSPGGLLYVGTWQKQILVIDEAQGKVIDKIQLQTGAPKDIEISTDRKKLFVSTWEKNGIEVVDLAARKVVNSFSLDEGNRKVRFSGFISDPQDQLLYTTIKVAVKQIDRFELEPSKLAVIDLAQKKIIRSAEFPKEENSTFRVYDRGIRVSPDGKSLFLFRENVLIFNTADFKLQDKIELSKPQDPGMERVGMGANNDPSDEPGMMTSVFNATDPVVHRPIFGIARVDLAKRAFDFTPVGPATQGMMGLHVSPDHKTGYTVALQENTPGNRRAEFWVFDMATRRLVNKMEFPGRTRFSFTISSNGNQLYIYGAGPTLEIFDAATLQLQKTIDVEADMTTQLIVMPRKG